MEFAIVRHMRALNYQAERGSLVTVAQLSSVMARSVLLSQAVQLATWGHLSLHLHDYTQSDECQAGITSGKYLNHPTLKDYAGRPAVIVGVAIRQS